MSDDQPSTTTAVAAPTHPVNLMNSVSEPRESASGTALHLSTNQVHHQPITTITATAPAPVQTPARTIDHAQQMRSLNMSNLDSAHADATVSAADNYAFQMSRARGLAAATASEHRNGVNAYAQRNLNGANPSSLTNGYITTHPGQLGVDAQDDYDPDSNVYVANLPSTYGKERLYQLFHAFGNIVRYKFVQPDEDAQPGYGFVQFAQRKDAHRAIKNLEGYVFTTGESIYLSIALRRRSSLSDEPTNLYVKNLPSSWSNEKLRSVFGAYGQIRQSKVVGDGIAFVRFEDHEQALNAISRLDKMACAVGNGYGGEVKLEVRFATRKTAANAYRLQHVPSANKANENNLYVRNLPKYYNQSSLETLFANYGKISSAKINDNGIAFVRFAHGEDARRAISELNGKKPPQFEEEIVVKLAHFDIGDSRNRWSQKFPTSPHGGNGWSQNGHGGHGGGQNAYRGGYAQNGRGRGHSNFVPNSSMYRSHGVAAPMPAQSTDWAVHQQQQQNAQQQQQQNGLRSPNNGHAQNGHAQSTPNGLPNGNANVGGTANGMALNGVNGGLMGMNGAMNGMGMGTMHNQHTLQALQQQMQQWNLGGTANTVNAVNTVNMQNGVGMAGMSIPTGMNSAMNGAMNPLNMSQFAFPGANSAVNGVSNGMAVPNMNSAPNLFAQQNQQTNQATPALGGSSSNPFMAQNANANAQQKVYSAVKNMDNDSENGSIHSHSQSQAAVVSDEAASKTWSKRQQELGDKLYQKVFARTGGNLAPKITGMLIKMGDKKAQKCIDEEPFLLDQIRVAKKLLLSQESIAAEGMSSPGNGYLNMPHTPTKLLSPSQLSMTPSMSLAHSNGSNHSAGPSLTQQLASIAFSSPMTTTTSLTNGTAHSTPQYNHSSMTPNSSINSRFQALNTKAVTPTSNGAVSVQPVNLFGAGMNGLSVNSVNSMPSMYPVNSVNGGVAQMNQMNVNGLSGVTGVSGMASLYQQLSPHTPNAGTASPKGVMTQRPTTASPMTAQQQQYLFTTIPNLGSGSGALSSLANGSLSPATVQQQQAQVQQQGMFGQVNMNNGGMNVNMNRTPTTAMSNVNAQAHIQQSGWGLANVGAIGGGNMQNHTVIPTQNAPQFMQPALFPRTQM